MKKILFLSVSAGAGHVRAAQALEAYAQLDDGIEAMHLDVMDFVPQTFKRIYVDTYIKMVQKFPALWGLLYKKMGNAKADETWQRLRRVVERLNTRSINKAIDAFAPDVVVCTHFLPAEILMHEINKGRFIAPVWLQVTDFDVHRMWLIPKMQGYFAANEEVKFRLEHMGIEGNRIHVTGIPIMPGFANPPAQDVCLKKYGLLENTKRTSQTNAPVMLLMGGGAGLGGLDEVAQQLLQQDERFKLVVLAGKNEKLLKSLNKVKERYPGRLFPQGFTQNVQELMACADLVITKPGGLTSSECLAMGLPMLVHEPIPGQEEHNADYLLEQGVALKAVDALGLRYRLQHLMDEPKALNAMRERARKIGQPLAGRKVLDVVLADLHKNEVNAIT